MSRFAKYLLVAGGSFLSGWLFETVVSTALGQRFVARVGLSDLTTVTGLKSARTYLSASAGLAASALIRGNSEDADEIAPSVPVGSLADLAEMMLATGAFLKLVTEFMSGRR